MLMLGYVLGAAVVIYLLLTLYLTYLVHQIPRRPVSDKPDWGIVTDTTIPAIDGGRLEVWRIEPAGQSRAVVVFAHGWGRNRGRMVYRARIFGQWGFATVIHSARDHGGSSPKKFMNAMRFAEDIESVLNWVGEPVILYGHSAGAAGAIIEASRRPHQIRLLFLEGCYANTKEALLHLYRWFNPFFGRFFAPAVLFWMDLFYKWGMNRVSPARLAPALTMPVLIIHGEKDGRFPLRFAETLRRSFAPGQAELFVAEGADHSDSSLMPEYRDRVKDFLDRHTDRWSRAG